MIFDTSPISLIYQKNQIIIENIKKSEIILIYQDKTDEEHFLIIGFKNTIILIDQYHLSVLQNIFSNNETLNICFFSSSKIIFDQNIRLKYNEIKVDSIFQDEISSFKTCLTINNQKLNKWEIIHPCISGFLIKQSYKKSNKNRIDDIVIFQDTEIFEKEDYIILRTLGFGSVFKTDLIYHIEKEVLLVIKQPWIPNSLDSEVPKLMKREFENYSNICHPLLPCFYGIVKNENFLVCEFIDGKNLLKIDKNTLSYEDKIKIIYEIMLIINFLHENDYVYRDLKPDNIMIDRNKTAVLIDLDRLINTNDYDYYDDDNCNIDFTNDFSSCFAAPEINSGEISPECDIYSLGMVIYYIMTGKLPIKDNLNIVDYPEINELFLLCTNKDQNERPLIHEIINYMRSINNHKFEALFNQYEKSIGDITTLNLISTCDGIDLHCSDPKVHYYLGNLYEMGELIQRDINKAIQYYLNAAKKKYTKALYRLGLIYETGKYISCDINKVIYYFTIAAEDKYPQAQYHLGNIYINNKFAQQNINKAIKYYSLAANQNYVEAQYKLGNIYYYDEYVSCDLDKAIHYYKMAANQNHAESQYILGCFYHRESPVSCDINKAIFYYTLAANQNHAKSQYNLGCIYHKEKYVPTNIEKAIYYYKLAADQNIAEAQYNLGHIYYDGKCIKRDINKAIQYYSLASNQNFAKANYNLGLIYFKGIYVKKDYNKALYYFTLAANQNNPESQVNVGVFYLKGEIIPRNLNKAIAYFTYAANQNNSEAQYYLGIIYYFDENGVFDINKSIHYLTLAANQNNSNAQFLLGYIYHEGKYTSDINKGIYYLTLAAKHNNSEAQSLLGRIYCFGLSVVCDIPKGIHYFTLAANNNFPKAQFFLGRFYLGDLGVERDIKKAIHYLLLAEKNNIKEASFNLGVIYYLGKYVKRDIKKSIYHFTIAANLNFSIAHFNLYNLYIERLYVEQDINKAINHLKQAAYLEHPEAQLHLRMFYCYGLHVNKDIKKGINLLFLSSKNGCHEAHFLVGFLYHEGKFVKRDIQKAIHFYKEGSSFNNQQSKNNLGIIYKNGFGTEVPKRIGYAIEYFKEAIHQKNDIISMFNLASLYFYENPIENSIDKSIELLVKSINEGLCVSKELLCLVLIKKELIKEDDLYDFICQMIISNNLFDNSVFEQQYDYYRNIDFIYVTLSITINSNILINTKKQMNSGKNKDIHDISSDFYEGFGYDIYNKENAKS